MTIEFPIRISLLHTPSKDPYPFCEMATQDILINVDLLE